MIKSALIGMTLALGLATAASAGMSPLPVNAGDSAIVKVAQGCGAGFWRGAGGVCHPMAVGRVCPAGYHLGPERRKCWPN